MHSKCDCARVARATVSIHVPSKMPWGASKSDFVAHQASEPVKAFKEAVAKAEAEGSIHRVSVEGHSFNESTVGYMQR